MSGYGDIQRLRSGRYRARLPRSAGAAGRTFDTEREAAEWLAAMAEQNQPRRSGAPKTLRWWGEIWLAQRKERDLVSYEDDERRWVQHVLPSDLAEMELRRIEPRHILAFTRWLAVRKKAVQVRGQGSWGG